MINKLWKWFVEAIKETLNLSWTLVGLVIATLTLTGSAQQVTGLATVITLVISFATAFTDAMLVATVVTFALFVANVSKDMRVKNIGKIGKTHYCIGLLTNF